MESEDGRSAALRSLLGQAERLAQQQPTVDEAKALDGALASASLGAIDNELLRRVAALQPIVCRQPPDDLSDVIGHVTVRFERAVSAARQTLGLGVKEDAQKLSRRLVELIARGSAPAKALEAERQDILRLLGADRVRWFVIAPTGTELVSAWATDASEPVCVPTTSSTLAGLAASEGRPISLARTPSGLEQTTWHPEEDWVPERAPKAPDAGEGGGRAASPSLALAVSLWRGTQLRGVLEFTGQRSDPVTSTDVSVASHLARALGEVLS